jgi:hypothetical protein
VRVVAGTDFLKDLYNIRLVDRCAWVAAGELSMHPDQVPSMPHLEAVTNDSFGELQILDFRSPFHGFDPPSGLWDTIKEPAFIRPTSIYNSPITVPRRSGYQLRAALNIAA